MAQKAEEFQTKRNEEMNQEPNQDDKTCIGQGFPRTSVGPRKLKGFRQPARSFHFGRGWVFAFASASLLLLQMLFALWMH